ncbi:ArsR/SmtB family transcription factor [Spirochaeta cellobiosiphila]|uniref:ArsR/SmtB family transcription factor n=1 Tax=Spirochaeta cellobiosiphila TaxID=504483 RepID=UPI0003FD41C5|nr:metalloregulator ArsR/SmtB family transcription factor [Spirochaeta cellobiosiphila]
MSCSGSKECSEYLLSPEDEKQLQDMAQALGNPIRFEIIKYLSTRPECITGDIVDVLPIAQSTTSQHLKVLKSSGWIQGTLSGTKTRYCLNSTNVEWFKKKIEEIF